MSSKKGQFLRNNASEKQSSVKFRKVKVKYFPHSKWEQISCILLQGKWFEAHSFMFGNSVSATVHDNLLIIIGKYPYDVYRSYANKMVILQSYPFTPNP